MKKSSTLFSKFFERFPRSWGGSSHDSHEEINSQSQNGSNSLAPPPRETRTAGDQVRKAVDDQKDRYPPQTLSVEMGAVELTSLAQKIRSLIGPIISPKIISNDNSKPASAPVYAQDSETNGREPIVSAMTPFSIPTPLHTPVPVSPVHDPHFLAMLSSPVVMNDDLPPGCSENIRERRTSVFNILDSMASPLSPGGGYGTMELAEDQLAGGLGNDWDGETSVFSDDSSVMMYSPLVPTSSSVVELAESEVMMMTPDSASISTSPGNASDGGRSKWNIWSFTNWRSSPSNIWRTSGGEHQEPTNGRTISPTRLTGRRVWVPSRTKLSLQAMWWGYRLYLPPPVLEALNDHHLEASNRGAIISSALMWFFGNFPVKALPGPLQPAAILLQAIVPSVGYIGTFVSWTWSTIKSYDIGFGVVLTATWLLPVALIPSTWNEADFPPASPRPPESTGVLPPDLDVATPSIPRPLSVRFQPMVLPFPTPETTPDSTSKSLPPLHHPGPSPSLNLHLSSPSPSYPSSLMAFGTPMSEIHPPSLASPPVISGSPYPTPSSSSPSPPPWSPALSPSVYISPNSQPPYFWPSPAASLSLTPNDVPPVSASGQELWVTSSPPPAPTPQTISLPRVDRQLTSSRISPQVSRSHRSKHKATPTPSLQGSTVPVLTSSRRRIPAPSAPSSLSVTAASSSTAVAFDKAQTMARRATGKEKKIHSKTVHMPGYSTKSEIHRSTRPQEGKGFMTVRATTTPKTKMTSSSGSSSRRS